MAVVGPPMHFAAGYDVDIREFLVFDGGESGPVLGVSHGTHRQLADRHQAVERLVPIRNAVSSDDSRGVFWIGPHSTHLGSREV